MKKSADLMSLLERICRTGRNPLPASRKLPGLLVREQPHRPVRPVVRGMTTGGSGITTIRENLRRQTQEPGKSTTGGQILFLSGQVDDRTILKYEKEAKDKSQESCYMAYIMDTIEEERVKGKTVEVGRAHFETEHTRFTILDAQDPVPNMISGASQADIGDFETGYERGQTCEHVLLAKTLGIGKLVVLINEMDEPTVKWSKERYDEIEAKMVSFLKSSGYNVKKDVQFLPISGLVGTNIQTRMDKSICSWWDGPCFFEVLDCIEFPLHDPKCPVRTIVDKCRNMDKIKSGTIREGDSLLVMPNKSHAKFIGLNLDESKARCAGPAENVRVKLFKEDVMAGLVFPSAEKVGLRHGYHNKLFSRKFSHVPHQGTESSHELLKPDGNLPPKVILGNKTVLMQKIQNALSQNIQKLNKVSLEHRYQTEFRPKLSCSGLLLPKGLNSDSTAFLHHQHHKQNRKTPQYLSAYELMIQRLRINNEDEWGHFWDQIINSRIFIVDTWDENVGNVETLHYDYGIKGSFKGEVDASFHDGKQGKKGTARISFVLWREDKVVCAEVYENLKCSSIHMAEGYAALALVFKCIELNITELVIWTDNVDIQGCITGSYTVKQIEEPSDLEKEHRNLFDLLGCMRNSFTLLRAMCKPRELMFLVDDLSTSEGGIPKLEDAIKKFNYQLSQKAIFKFSHAASAKAIIKSFGYCMFVRRHETKFFVLVDNLDKLDAVAQITDALCPSGVYIAVQQLDEKPLNFQIRLQQMVGSNLRHQSSVDDDRTLLHYSTKDNGMELLIIVDGTVPHGTYDCLGCFTVILVSSMERKQLDPAISEFNALSYRYFMGVAV